MLFSKQQGYRKNSIFIHVPDTTRMPILEQIETVKVIINNLVNQVCNRDDNRL